MHGAIALPRHCPFIASSARPHAACGQFFIHCPRSFERDENPSHPGAVAEPRPRCPPPQGPLSCQARRRLRLKRRMRLPCGVTTPAPSACPLFADQRLARPEPQPALSRPARQLRAAERAKPRWQALRGFLRWRLFLFSGSRAPRDAERRLPVARAGSNCKKDGRVGANALRALLPAYIHPAGFPRCPQPAARHVPAAFSLPVKAWQKSGRRHNPPEIS